MRSLTAVGGDGAFGQCSWATLCVADSKGARRRAPTCRGKGEEGENLEKARGGRTHTYCTHTQTHTHARTERTH